MVSDKIIKFVKERLRREATEEEIRKALFETGYSPQETREIIRKAKRETRETNFKTNRVGNEPSSSPQGKLSRSRLLKSIGLLVGTLLIIGAAFFIYNKVSKVAPVSMLPKDSSFYARIKINPEHQQVKNLNNLLSKFPYYQEISQKLKEEMRQLEPKDLSYSDFLISKELIIASVAPVKPSGSITDSMIFILPSPDRKKINKLKKELEEPQQEEIKKIKYRGETITEIEPSTNKATTLSSSEEQPQYLVQLKGHLVNSSKIENIKKVIDVVKDRRLVNLFKKDKTKSIRSNTAHQKIKKHLPDNYLGLFYANVNLGTALQATEKTEVAERLRDLPLTASLNLFQNQNSGKRATAGALTVEKDKIKIETYTTTGEGLKPAQFSLNQSLAHSLPQKLGGRKITSYREGINLHRQYKTFKNQLLKNATSGEKKKFEQTLRKFKEEVGFDLEENMKYLKDNYAVVLMSESSGTKVPLLSLAARSERAERLAQNLSQVTIPQEITRPFQTSLGQARSKAKDARITADMGQLRSKAELIASEEGGYEVSCSYDNEMQALCDDVKSQGGAITIHQSWNGYCAYTPLNSGEYYCTNSKGRAITSYNNPDQFCNSNSFDCPQRKGTEPSPASEPRVSPSQETIAGVEVYSLPLMGELKVGFTAKGNRFLAFLGKKGAPELLKKWGDNSSPTVYQMEKFRTQFKNIPEKITSLSYAYPYGYTGVLKYAVRAVTENMKSTSESLTGMNTETVKDMAFKLIDKGIAPYLKMLKTSSSHSYTTESGITVTKAALTIEELPPEEKRTTEDFWNNFGSWIGAMTAPALEGARTQARDARITSEMGQMRTKAELIHSSEGSYGSFSCNYDNTTQTLCNDIKSQGGEVIIHSSAESYCAYTKLNDQGYYCINSAGQASQAEINPGQGYCTPNSFNCPSRY